MLLRAKGKSFSPKQAGIKISSGSMNRASRGATARPKLGASSKGLNSGMKLSGLRARNLRRSFLKQIGASQPTSRGSKFNLGTAAKASQVGGSLGGLSSAVPKGQPRGARAANGTSSNTGAAPF